MESNSNPIKLVIAEDQGLILQSLVMSLKTVPEFLVCGTARNGNLLLGILKDIKPDIILMDIKMPYLNGLEATRIIFDKTPWIKVIILSMHTHPSFIKDALKAGANGFLSKDCSFDELCEAIHQVYQGNTYLFKEASDTLLNNFVHQDESESDEIKSLTNSELKIIQALADGLTTREIAAKSYITEKTVERHKSNILKKMKLKNTAQLIRVALEKGLLLY